jgi:hypothetical protein
LSAMPFHLPGLAECWFSENLLQNDPPLLR